MIAALGGLALPIGTAWLALRALGLRRASDSAAVTGAVACCIGLALAAVGTFFTLTLGGHLTRTYAAVDACVWVALGVLAWRGVRRRADEVPPRVAPPALDAGDWGVRVAFVVVALAALAVPIVEYLASPHGQWDAWAIWNTKARFMYRAGPDWLASSGVPWSAPSHPMFVSLAVARLWAYSGAELTVVPAALSIVYGIALVALVVGALDTRTRHAWVAGAVVAAPFTVSHLVAAQTADLAVALFVTASVVTLRGAVLEGWRGPRARRTLALAGLLGGCAALTKNEGFVFLFASSLAVAWLAVRDRRLARAIWWGAAAVPLAALMLWFKVTFPVGTPEYLATEAGAPGPLQLLLDVDRVRWVIGMTLGYWWRWGSSMAMGALIVTTLVSMVAVVRSGEAVDRGLGLVVVVMLASYYLIWVLSPLDTPWLIATTFDRLLAQVWPTLVLLAAFGSGTTFMQARHIP